MRRHGMQRVMDYTPDPVAPVITQVDILPLNFFLTTSGTQQMTAIAYDKEGTVVDQTGRIIVWTSSDPTAATVSATGLVTGLATGNVLITVRIDGVAGTTPSAVSVGAQAAVTVVVDQTTVAITTGNVVQRSVTVFDVNGNQLIGRVVTVSDAGSTATTLSAVTGTGPYLFTITGDLQGSATVTVTCETAFSLIAVTVTDAPVMSVLQSITLSVSTINATTNQAALPITATGKDQFGSPMSGVAFTWLSSVPSHGSVSASGNPATITFTGTTAGDTDITATSGSITSAIPCAVHTVAPVASSVTLNAASVAGNTGGTYLLQATVRDASNVIIPGATVTWASNSGNATVTGGAATSKTVSFVSAGGATITATSGAFSAQCVFTITDVIPGSYPVGYAINRPGIASYLIQGQDWQGLSPGTDGGFSLLQTIYNSGTGPSTGGLLPTQMQLVPDPWGVFGQINRCAMDDWRTVTHKVVFPTAQPIIWLRIVVRLWRDDYSLGTAHASIDLKNPTGGQGALWGGATSTYGQANGGYPTFWTCGTDTPGESGTLKWIFLFPGNFGSGAAWRQEMVWISNGQMQNGTGADMAESTSPPSGPALASPAVQTYMVQTLPLASFPQCLPHPGMYAYSKPGGQTSAIAASSTPGTGDWRSGFGPQYTVTYPLQPADQMSAAARGTATQAHHAWGTRDWYEYIVNYEMVSASEHIKRFFFRRLTVNGAYTPWPVPCWQGYRTTGGVGRLATFDQVTGNRSGRNPAATGGAIGSGIEYFDLGPWEILTHPDPYGWDAYGK